MKQSKIDTVIFDLGGVLIDWNPEYLYEKIFPGNPKKMKWFLKNVCSPQWNMEQDAGRSLKTGTELLVKTFPEYKDEINAFYQRWEEMLKGEITKSVLILNKLKRLNKVKLYALTNWSSETFPIALQRFDCLRLFEGIVVSGDEMTRKPYPKIYQILFERYTLSPETCLFIDDNIDNVIAAKSLNMNALHFKNANQLETDLETLKILA